MKLITLVFLTLLTGNVLADDSCTRRLNELIDFSANEIGEPQGKITKNNEQIKKAQAKKGILTEQSHKKLMDDIINHLKVENQELETYINEGKEEAQALAAEVKRNCKNN